MPTKINYKDLKLGSASKNKFQKLGIWIQIKRAAFNCGSVGGMKSEEYRLSP
jgi:hypothetical protein